MRRPERSPGVRAPLITFGVLAAAAATLLFPGPFELSREGLARGEVWRFWTGHLAHYSLYHFLVDAGTALALGWLFENRAGRVSWGLLLAASASAISVAFLLLEPHLSAYRGLSGVDCAAFATAIVIEARRRPIWAGALGLAFAAKLVYEQLTGGFLLPSTGWGDMGLPVLSAHTLGALVGFVGGRFALRRSQAMDPALES